MTEHDSIDLIAERITPALTLVLNALVEALPTAIAACEALDYVPSEDRSLLNNLVRRDVRERLKPMFEGLAHGNANMSPVHLPLGPYQARLVHAREGGVPPAASQARIDYYAANDQPSLALNVFPPDSVVVIEEEVEAVNEYTLLLLWDSEGDQLTQFTLARPFASQRHELLHLLVIEEAAEDLHDIERKRDEGDERTGTENGDE